MRAGVALGPWSTWAASQPPAVVTATVVWGLTLAAGVYLLAALTVAVVVAAAPESRRGRLLAGLLRRGLPSSTHRLVGLGVGLAVLGATAQPAFAGPSGSRPAQRPAASVRSALGAGSAGAGTAGDNVAAPRLWPVAPRPDHHPGEHPVVHHPPAPRGRRSTHAAGSARVWTVAAGDSLWSIAEAHLTVAGGAAPSLDAVSSYWSRLVAANRELGDPDLIFPGDRVVLPPPVPGSPRS